MESTTELSFVRKLFLIERIEFKMGTKSRKEFPHAIN